MFCPNCGAELPDGSRFCGSCGVNLAELLGEVASEPVVQGTGTIEVPKVSVDEDNGYVKPGKKKKKGLITAIAVAVAVIAVVLVVVKGGLSSGSSSNAYVYMSNGKYELLTNIKKNQSIEIASSKGDATFDSLLSFSPDGKYVYYYTKYDSISSTGSLCRAEYGKLKANSTKNDKYIEILATNVRLGFRFLSDGTVTYLNGEDNLYYFDGSESLQIAKSVNDYYTDDNNRLVYETGTYSEGGYTLYGVDLKDKDNKIKLAANYSSLYYVSDFDNIFYTKDDDDFNSTLYVVGFEEDSVELGDKVTYISCDDGVAYFTASNGTTLNLHDYVEDNLESDDTVIKEPDLEDYGVPTYGYYTLDRVSDPDEYDEIYTSCTVPVAFYRSWFSYKSLEYAAENDSEHANEYKAFVNKYKSREDENGYIVVTDDIKKDLKSLANTCGQGYDGEWLKFCFYKEQNGTDYDYDSYDADYEKYTAAVDRESIREELQKKENAYEVKTLYCYNKGSLKAINENVLNVLSCGNGILFNTTDLVTDRVKIENVYSVSDVTALFEVDKEAQNYVVLTVEADATVMQMSESAAETYAEANESEYTRLVLSGSKMYMEGSSAGLSVASISDGVIGSFEIITDDGSICDYDKSTLYYISGEYTNNDHTYCDIYRYSDGKSTRIAQDVLDLKARLYSDEVVLAYTGYREYYGYELTMFDSKGNKTMIADDVTQYIRVDKSTILYISDNDLYVYDGKEKTLLQSGANYIWSQLQMEISRTFGMHDYGVYYDGEYELY